MIISILAKGFLIGFIIGAPMGPVGALIIRRLLLKGKMAGLISGLGSTVADLVYVIIAVLGVTFIKNLLIKHEMIIQIIGGLVVFLIGIKIFYTKTSNKVGENGKYSILGAFSSAFFLCLSNPTPIITSIALLAGIGVHDKNDIINFIYLLLGFIVGAYIWWVALTIGVSMIRKKISSESIPVLNKFFGVLIAIVGIYISVAKLLKLKYFP